MKSYQTNTQQPNSIFVWKSLHLDIFSVSELFFFKERFQTFVVASKNIAHFDLTLIELVSRRRELRLLVFPCYALWISLIWGLSYSRENFSLVPCYFFSKIRWNSCVLVCGHACCLLSFWYFGEEQSVCICMCFEEECISFCFSCPLLTWGWEKQDDLCNYYACAWGFKQNYGLYWPLRWWRQ